LNSSFLRLDDTWFSAFVPQDHHHQKIPTSALQLQKSNAKLDIRGQYGYTSAHSTRMEGTKSHERSKVESLEFLD
jgi:hypothetical protein